MQHIPLNSVLKRLPNHLQPFVIPQPYNTYTAKDQAVWRYVMRKSVAYLGKKAHHSYLDGLKKTGVSSEEIPHMQGMNRILKEIGWAAVSVDGFIPPSAFMEFQAYNVLVIAADIRTAEHIAYTPAPDIIHEAAGHAPIIANPEYAEYLRRFGEIGSKAISSAKDYALYEAIRHLSIIKEDPNTSDKAVADAEYRVAEISKNMGEPSEMAQLRNLHWWTVEYGLIGTLDNPKIYGAGLLSSIGESEWCMSEQVAKLPYTITAAQTAFDITKPQPQLFVTPDFAHLSVILEKFANTMALRKGGLSGLQKAINSQNLSTLVLSTGIQISGLFTNVISHEGLPIYFQTTGPTALAYQNKELIGHGKTYHADGFGSPVGKLKGRNLAIEDMSPKDLETYGLYEGKTTTLEFESGIKVMGEIITGRRNLQGKIILISFKNCTVTYNDDFLFKPEWGVYDMAVGASVTSVYAGVADPESYDLHFDPPSEKTHKISYSTSDINLHKLYQTIRNFRTSSANNFDILEAVFKEINSEYKSEWLLTLEVYELLANTQLPVKKKVFEHLELLKAQKPFKKLITEGLAVLS